MNLLVIHQLVYLKNSITKSFKKLSHLTKERPGTDHVIAGPIRGLEKTASDGADKPTDTQTDGHRDSTAESAQWGRFSKNGYVLGL